MTIKPLITLLLIAFSSYDKKNEIPVEQVKVNFLIYNAGIAVEGTLSKLKATIEFDPEHPEESKVVAVADPRSINTGINIRDKHLLRSDYFYVEKFPEIRLQSKSIKTIKKNLYRGKFDLTIKNITQPVVIIFKYINKGYITTITGDFEIDRLNFGLGEKSTILGDKVKITFSATLPTSKVRFETRNN